jgi:hypothetical protein
MHVELSTDDPSAIDEPIARATAALAPQETLLVTIQRGRDMYHLALSSRLEAAPEQATCTSGSGDAP